MKNTLILLLVLLLLGGVAYMSAKKEKAELKTSVAADDRKFAIKDIDNIGKIFWADRKGKSNTLTRTKGSKDWVLNGKYKARLFAVETMLSTFKNVEMAFIPPQNSIPNIVETLGAHGIKVEVYDFDNNKMKSFYVGGTTNDEEATYLIMEGAEQPYAMKVPTMVGGLRSRFTLDLEEWRDKDIIDIPIKDITYVSVEYPMQKNKSFILEKTAGAYSVRPFYETTPKKTTPLIKGIADTYLSTYESFIAENFINSHKHRDSISQMLPFAILTVKDKKGDAQSIRFHPLRNLGADGLPLKDAKVTDDTAVERYHADHSRGDYYLIQQRLIGKAFWDYAHFFTEEKKVKN
jgi:Domain of unknown function (DUF4340)